MTDLSGVEYPSPFDVGPGGTVGPADEPGPFVYPYASVTVTQKVLEAIGPTATTQENDGYTALYGIDAYSTDTLVGYLDHPLQGDGSYTQTLYSYERWIRIQFDGTFNTLRNFRFWADAPTPVPGWDIKWGSTDTYSTPRNTASLIAVNALPITDPGVPNLGGASRLVGPGTQYTDWLVIQAVVDTSVFAQPGPAFGYALTSPPTVNRLFLQIGWIQN